MTLADANVLIVGCAIALALHWYNPWVQETQPIMEPRWRIIALFLEEAVEKACLALIPLMLSRRFRLGGLCRPGELLLVVCASCAIFEQVDWLSGLDMESHGVIEADDVYWASLTAACVACVAAIGGLIFLRDRISDGVRSSLLVIAVAGSYPWLNWPLESLQIRLIEILGMQDDMAIDHSFFVACFAIRALVPALLGVAALSDAIQNRTEIGVMSGIGLVMGAVALINNLALWLPGYYTSAFPAWNDPLLYLLLAAPASSALLGYVVWQVMRHRCRHWFASGWETRSPSRGDTSDPVSGRIEPLAQ